MEEMSSKAEQDSDRNPVTFHAARAVLLVLVVIAALFAFAERAEAKGVPTKLIVFTDKKVYVDWAFNQDGHNTAPPPAGYAGSLTADLAFYIYAIVLDDDGNIMTGRAGNLSGSINTTRLDHWDKSNTAIHHAELSSTLFNAASLTFYDGGGGVPGDVAGDGIYVALSNPTDPTFSAVDPYVDDHLRLNITVTENTVGTEYTYALVSGLRCKAAGTNHGTHSGSGTVVDNCAACHPGYEHFYENVSGTIPESKLDVHFGRMNPPDVIADDKGFGDWIWNSSSTATGGVKLVEWGSRIPGSRYCPACHITPDNAGIYDYGNARADMADRPSCSQGVKTGLYENSATVTCHTTTEMEGMVIPQWSQAGAVTGTFQNYNITKAKSHNHTSNATGVPCALCHSTPHGANMPNMSADISSSGNINQQCTLCHNITGGLNITANGGKNVNHTNPDCKACHMDSSQKLDSHLVPTAGIPNANCTLCHDLGGKASYHIDFNTFNKSTYVHNLYNLTENKRPLNFNATNGSALRPVENKICWGCHGDDPNNDGRANFSEQPSSDHPSKYKNPRTCEQCHQNASSPWGAPQNVAHSNNTNNVRTPGAPNCYDCHGQPANYNNSQQDPDYNNSLKATLAYHYGTGFPALKALRGTGGYCIQFCHQNTSSPFEEEFSNMENMQRPNHSAMLSRPENQSCIASQCHAAEELHGSEMKKPTLASGAFGNVNCTGSGCHSLADTGFDYKSHNNVVNCTSCHMDNKGSNIHPIKYLQNDGIDFAQVNTTAASCKLCHKNSQGDATLAKWGVTARKVGAQHHSDDPKNGSKWNKTIDPYWDYVPHEITFVNGWKNNSNRGFISNFNAMNDTNYSATRISENTTADAYVGSHPPNQNFTSSASGWYASGTATTLAWSGLAEDGNPAGGITVASVTKSEVVDANWTAAFTYPRSGAVAEAIIKLDSKLVKAANINTGALKAINVSINDNAGNVTDVYSRNLPNTAEPDWIESGEISIANPNTVFWKNGVYNVTIRTRWTGLGGSTTPDVKLAYDNVFVNISEVDYKKYNFTFYINNTPNSDNLYTLFVGYQTHTEPARLFVLNGSSFEYKTDLSSGAFTKAIVPLSKNEYSNGNITLRINDSNGPGETSQEVDVHADYIDIEYMFVESYQWINNSRLHYPCEYCHASNKHYEHALGIPYEFKGNNYEGQDVNATTNWCASCHWQGYSNGGKNYNNAVQAFLNHTLPVPPEITGNATYGANTSKPEYKDHSAWGKDDLSCWGCHKGKLPDGSNSTVFLHNLSTGSSGGRNCTACHSVNGSATGMLVNFTSVNRSMHANLNRNATGNVTNKPCWGCHGTKNGTWANESDQPLNDHNQTFKQNARKCQDCHNDTQPLFNARPVTDHIPSGLSASTDVNTSKYNKTYCAYCHNNSVTQGFADPDDLGSSPMNASSAHYGANKTAGKLMSATNNTTDCVFCHKNTSNMAKWGIISGSLSNISNKNGTLNTGFNHTPYSQSSGCYSCHGGTVANFHVSAMSPGEKGNPNCAGCHNISSPGSYAKVDFVAINQSAHGSLNNKSTSNAGNVTNKPCWGCHGTKNGSYANQSDQPLNDHNNTYKSSPRKCEDCHINGTIQINAPGLTEHIMPGKNASTEINVTEGYCTVCHNNSITSNSDTDGMGILSVINASAAHYAKDASSNLMTTVQHSDNCTYCHFVNNGSGAWLTPRKPLTSTHSSYGNDTSPNVCWGCHVDSQGEPSTFHVQAINKGAGSGPNCRSCHNTSDTSDNKGHIDGSVFNASIHGNMSTNSSIADPNEPCWGCHGSGESEEHNTTGISGKGTYRNPFNCTDCHISGGVRNTWASARNALNVAEHYTNGAEIKASYNATATFSCLKCHQDIGEMRLNNSDPDNNKTAWTSGGDNYNITIGGNNSPYHYGRKRSDLRSGTNATCDYCHRNSTSVFPLASTNRSIYEHTDSGTRNTSAGSCTGGKCHASGFIHNLTLTKPAVQNWTANSKDYCAPCHKVNNNNATKYVYAHNTSNISVVSMDCGYCHNSSSQGVVSNGALKLHTSGITNTSTTNSTCVTCHKDSKYVGTSRVIRTHYPGAPAGKANTSPSTWDCEECHGWTYGTKMHNQSLIKKPSYDCNACHNASGGSSYKSNPSLFVNLTRHDNTSLNGANVNCNTCHNSTNRLEPFHFTNWSNGTVEAPGWAGWTNGTRANCTDCHVTYNNTVPFNAEPADWHKGTYGSTLSDCYQCHSNLTVLNSSDTKAPVEMHNVTRAIDWGNCNACHAPKYGGAPKVDNTSLNAVNSMHAGIDGATSNNINPACKACHGGNVSFHKNSSANSCTYCHITGKIKYSAKNVSEHILNGTYTNTTVNTSRYQQVFCDLCHNNSLAAFNDDTPGTENATTAHYGQNKSAGKLMSPGVNSTDCVFCHKNSSNMAKWGVLSTSKANISNRGDHTSHSTNTVCYDCHVDTRAMPFTFHVEELNEGSGSSPNCVGCHNTGSSNKKVDFTAANDSSNIHKNLNSAASAAGYDSANKPCWACHGNGTATAHIDNIYKAPRICESCHINASAPYGAPQVREHYRNGSDIKATNATNNTRSCLACHQNISEMRLSNNDTDEGTFDAEGDGVNGTGISAYHYGKRRSDLRSGVNTSCTYCHQNSSAVFPLSDANKSIYEHTSSTANITNASLACTGSKCHASGFIHNSTLTKPAVQAWTSGKQDYCAPCHRAGDTNATKYVYSHNTSITPIGDDCGFCHNASSQGAAGSTVKVHTSGLTNNTSPISYGNCSGCHNGTSLYVGAGKQILSHMPNASQYRGNTSMSSYTCEYCHNLSGKPSMHSAGMTRSNGTCDTCHFSRTSPYNATKKIIATNDYNHTYVGQNTCAISQCHNASNGSVFHMDKYAAGVVAEPEKFNSMWNDRYTIGFTDASYPYADCIDCHREHNNSYPFNNTYPFNYSTNYSFNYEANHTGENKKLHTASDLIKSCYNCHTNRTDDTDRYMVHNVTIEPLVGGPACTKCHNLSAISDVPSNKRVNHTALNQSVHKNLTNFTAWDNSPHKATAVLLDSACWTCHATDITSIPGNEHPDRAGGISKAFQCKDCHTSGGAVGTTNPQVYQNATKVYKHYPGSVLSGQKIHSTNYTAGSCQICHNRSIVTSNNLTPSLNATVSHYAVKFDLAQTNTNYSCDECHGNSAATWGVPKQLADNGKHSMYNACQGPCHNPYYVNNNSINPIILHNASIGIYYDCYKGGCHAKAYRAPRGGR